MKQLRKVEPSQFLSGWKEIASYMGKGVRTVQRYERQLGLPVRRPAGKSSGSVIATRAELDGWVKASSIRNIFYLRNPESEYAFQSSTLKQQVSEMSQLREQMFALRHELRNSVDLLRHSISELQDTLTPLALEASSLYSQTERDSLARSVLVFKGFPIKYPKAS